MRNNIWAVTGLLGFLILVTAGIVLYASGFRLDLSQRTFAKTGMILVKSLPDGARVFLNGELSGATDSTIGSLEPENYHLKIEKEGHISWEGDVEVKAELVTNITAILPPISPSLTAITQSGARLVAAAPSGTKAAFLSGDRLFLLPLNNPFLGFLRTRTQEIAQESEDLLFSKVTRIEFSPNEDQLLLTAGEKSVTFKIQTGAGGTKVANPDTLRTQWQTLIKEQRSEAIKTLKIPDEFKDLALTASSVWSPDERKFLYEKSTGGKRQIWLANFTDPVPVGEEINRVVLETTNAELKIFWLASSQHFVAIEGEIVSILDLDGTNRREIFSGKLAEAIALSSTDLAKIIVVTSISPNAPANLYGISLK